MEPSPILTPVASHCLLCAVWTVLFLWWDFGILVCFSSRVACQCGWGQKKGSPTQEHPTEVNFSKQVAKNSAILPKDYVFSKLVKVRWILQLFCSEEASFSQVTWTTIALELGQVWEAIVCERLNFGRRRLKSDQKSRNLRLASQVIRFLLFHHGGEWVDQDFSRAAHP